MTDPPTNAARLGVALRSRRLDRRLSQAELAQQSKLKQADVSRIERGHTNVSLATLGRLADALGCQVAIIDRPTLTGPDERLLRLHEAVAEELVKDSAAVRARAQRNLDRMRDAIPSALVWLDEWRRLLDGPLSDLVAVIVDRSENACALRQSSPFAGVLDGSTRWKIIASTR
jgi:transcriptional regulator with XRE-family HTH domain